MRFALDSTQIARIYTKYAALFYLGFSTLGVLSNSTAKEAGLSWWCKTDRMNPNFAGHFAGKVDCFMNKVYTTKEAAIGTTRK